LRSIYTLCFEKHVTRFQIINLRLQLCQKLKNQLNISRAAPTSLCLSFLYPLSLLPYVTGFNHTGGQQQLQQQLQETRRKRQLQQENQRGKHRTQLQPLQQQKEHLQNCFAVPSLPEICTELFRDPFITALDTLLKLPSSSSIANAVSACVKLLIGCGNDKLSSENAVKALKSRIDGSRVRVSQCSTRSVLVA